MAEEREIEEVDDSYSNKAGRRGTQEKVPKFDSPTSEKADEADELKSQVEDLRSQVAHLSSQICDIIFGRRSRSRSPVHNCRSRSWKGAIAGNITQLRFQISKLTFPIRSRPRAVISQLGHLTRSRSRYRGYQRIRSTSQRYRYCQQTGRFSLTLEDEEEMPEEREQAPKSGNSENDEVPECSNKSESETAHQRYLRKGKAAIIDSSSSDMIESKRLLLDDKLAADNLMQDVVDSLLNRVSDLKYQALHLIIQAGGARSQALDLTSQAGGARAQAHDLASQARGATSQSRKAKSKAQTGYEGQGQGQEHQHQHALTPRNNVAKEDELKLMRAVERTEIINKSEPERPVHRNLGLPEKVVHLRSQVTDLQALVTDLKSLRRSNNSAAETHPGGWISRFFHRPGRSSPTPTRIRETESSSSDAKRHGKVISKGLRWFSLHRKSGKTD